MLNSRLRNASPAVIRLAGVVWLVLGAALVVTKWRSPQSLQGSWNSPFTYVIGAGIIGMGLYHLLTGRP